MGHSWRSDPLFHLPFRPSTLTGPGSRTRAAGLRLPGFHPPLAALAAKTRDGPCCFPALRRFGLSSPEGKQERAASAAPQPLSRKVHSHGTRNRHQQWRRQLRELPQRRVAPSRPIRRACDDRPRSPRSRAPELSSLENAPRHPTRARDHRRRRDHPRPDPCTRHVRHRPQQSDHRRPRGLPRRCRIKYEPVQNDSAFAVLDTITDESGAHFETAGALFGGRKCSSP